MSFWVAGTVAAVGVGTAVIGSKAAGKAARASAAGDQASIDEQARQYDLTRSDFAPWRQAGQNALTKLQDPMANFSTSPDYNFVRTEGTRNIGNSFAARGGAFSGNALKALTEFNSNLAGGQFGDWWNRQAGLAGVGQSATNSTAVAGENAANNIGFGLQNMGNARASGIAQGANAWGGALSGVGQGLGYYLANQSPSNGLNYFTPTVRKM